MNTRKICAIARRIEKIVAYLGNYLPRGREYWDLEPNCNIQWDSLRGYKDDLMTITEHSVGTHTFEDNKPGFVVFETVRIMYQGKVVFCAQYDRVPRGKIVYEREITYVSGRWESKLASLFKKAEQVKRLQDKKNKKGKNKKV